MAPKSAALGFTTAKLHKQEELTDMFEGLDEARVLITSPID